MLMRRSVTRRRCGGGGGGGGEDAEEEEEEEEEDVDFTLEPITLEEPPCVATAPLTCHGYYASPARRYAPASSICGRPAAVMPHAVMLARRLPWAGKPRPGGPAPDSLHADLRLIE